MSRILISLIYCSLYVVWAIRGGYSWIYFFGFEFLIISAVLKSHYSFKKKTQEDRKTEPNAFADDYWKLFVRYGVYIYTPRAAESIAVSFTFNRFAGYLFTLIFLLLGSWVAAAACFVNTFLSGQMAGWLDPTFFMQEFAQKKGLSHYDYISEAIEELRE